MKKNTIKNISACEIIDSRGFPTVLAKVTLSDGISAIASVPSGASTGIHEAHELRDNDKHRYNGKGVLKAVAAVSEISDELSGLCVFRQKELDKLMCELDGNENKSRLGANAILAVSLACARVAAKALSIPLFRYLGGVSDESMPVPMMNILNGGAHAANNIDIQEFMIMPVGFDTVSERIRCGCEVYRALREILISRKLSVGVGDEGGFAPNLSNEREAIELILEAITKAGYTNNEVLLALDAAASEWKHGESYRQPKSGKEFTRDELISYFSALTRDYPIVSIEDPLGEDDFEGFRLITEKLGERVQIVGDDLFVTNTERLKRGIREKSANAILIKPNQIGTLSETINAVNLAKSAGYNFIISHRSGDVDDTFIADLAVATSAPYIKTGAPCRMERVAKYNRLIRIENGV